MKTSQRNSYDDIIHLPHPVSSKHPQMPAKDRAAQFSPFAALTGHEAAIKETARLTDSRAELDETVMDMISEKLGIVQTNLRAHPEMHPEITVTYFQPDSRKDGGAYISKTAEVKKIDEYQRLLVFMDGTEIPLGQIMEIESELWRDQDIWCF